MELLGYVATVLAVAIPILMASKQETLSQKDYAFRSSAVVALLIAKNLFFDSDTLASGMPGDVEYFITSVSIGAVLAAINIACTALLALWSVHRLNDADKPKWWCLLLLFSIPGIVFWIVLMTLPSNAQKVEQSSDQEIPGTKA